MSHYIVSIVTVTRNCVDTIDRTLNSISAVKTDEIEYIVIDGSSKDGTVERVRERARLCDILLSEPDNGIYHAMNKGIRLASGKYIVFINGDDEVKPSGFIETVEALRFSKDHIFCCQSDVVDEGRNVGTLVPVPWKLMFFNSIPHPSSFIRTDIIKMYEYSESYKIAADYNFFLNMFLQKKVFSILPFITAIHHRGGASSNTALSEREVTDIKRSALGKGYYVIKAISSIYRSCKRLSGGWFH